MISILGLWRSGTLTVQRIGSKHTAQDTEADSLKADDSRLRDFYSD